MLAKGHTGFQKENINQYVSLSMRTWTYMSHSTALSVQSLGSLRRNTKSDPSMWTRPWIHLEAFHGPSGKKQHWKNIKAMTFVSHLQAFMWIKRSLNAAQHNLETKVSSYCCCKSCPCQSIKVCCDTVILHNLLASPGSLQNIFCIRTMSRGGWDPAWRKNWECDSNATGNRNIGQFGLPFFTSVCHCSCIKKHWSWIHWTGNVGTSAQLWATSMGWTLQLLS